MFNNINLPNTTMDTWTSDNGIWRVNLIVTHIVSNAGFITGKYNDNVIGYKPTILVEKLNAKGEFVTTRSKLPKYVEEVITAANELVAKLDAELLAELEKEIHETVATLQEEPQNERR